MPSYINAYRDDRDLLFSMVFSKVSNASACIILSSPSTTVNDITQKTEELSETHQIQTASCYLNSESNVRCIAVFFPKEEVPNTIMITKINWFSSNIEGLKYIGVKSIWMVEGSL